MKADSSRSSRQQQIFAKVVGQNSLKTAQKRLNFSSRGAAPHPAGAPAPDPGWGSRPRPPKLATLAVTIIPVGRYTTSPPQASVRTVSCLLYSE